MDFDGELLFISDLLVIDASFCNSLLNLLFLIMREMVQISAS